ncbi:MAG: hypothetical protein JW795_22970 [Chitinivibrionales bacterium]|nr:hypothetical protein [Chitinivibrionales bacterium]
MVQKQDSTTTTQLATLQKAVLDAAGGTTDANRLYSILLDTKESANAENMYDIAETLMRNEKSNSKIALDQLWSLKKNLTDDDSSKTVDMLINHFQEKLNVLRNKEESIKKISKESRDLLDDKRKRDAEIATVKQQIADCTEEVDRLTKKMTELRGKEQELTLIESQLHKELQTNTNEVVGGLYEIIFSNLEHVENSFGLNTEGGVATVPSEIKKINDSSDITTSLPIPDAMESKMETNLLQEDTDSYLELKNSSKPAAMEPAVQSKEVEVPFPKSAVKTTNGIIIGEYYYDPKVPKNKRHYVYNSNFFRKRVLLLVKELSKKFNATYHAEAVQILQDAYKRVTEKSNLHFEIATNEILNKNVLKELWQNIMRHDYTLILSVCSKLNAKIEVLGKNYVQLLTEQLNRFNES